MEIRTMEFDLVAGKKPVREQIEAELNGFKEVFRRPVSGGFKVTYAKQFTAMNGNKRVTVFLLDEMPPEDQLEKGVAVQSVKLSRPATVGQQEQVFEGSYGIAGGRKFFVLGEPKKPAGRPKKQQA